MNLNDIDSGIVVGAVYLLCATLFFLGLKRLGSPATARTGNLLASLGMFIAVVVTLFDQQILSYRMIVVGVLIGSVVGALMARSISMNDMPQLVAAFNGLGGGASALVAASEFVRLSSESAEIPSDVSTTIVLGMLIGLVTASGSAVAFAKLQGIMSSRPVTFPLQKSAGKLARGCEAFTVIDRQREKVNATSWGSVL